MKQIGTNRWVRSRESCGWINEEDLPLEKVKAIYPRIEREREAREGPLYPQFAGRL
jgi:hypothetical protein